MRKFLVVSCVAILFTTVIFFAIRGRKPSQSEYGTVIYDVAAWRMPKLVESGKIETGQRVRVYLNSDYTLTKDGFYIPVDVGAPFPPTLQFIFRDGKIPKSHIIEGTISEFKIDGRERFNKTIGYVIICDCSGVTQND